MDTTTTNAVRTVLERYFGEKATPKLVRVIQNQLAEQLRRLGGNHQWYDVHVNKDFELCFKLYDTEYKFDLVPR